MGSLVLVFWVLHVLLNSAVLKSIANGQGDQDPEAPTLAPTNVETIPLGARVLRVEWVPLPNTFSVTGYRIVTSPPNGEAITAVAPGGGVSEFTLTGLSVYEYFNDTGVEYSTTVRAFNAIGIGPVSNTSLAILPPCPGTCDYRNFRTNDTECSRASCICNRAFTGVECSEPAFGTMNLNLSETSTGLMTVEWSLPQISTLDGRVVVMFRVNVTVIDSMNTRDTVSSVSTPPNRNSVTVDISNATVNYLITVETVTDVEGDIAITERYAINVPPGPVVALTAEAFHTSISLSWEPPTTFSDPLTAYVIEYVHADSQTSTTQVDSTVLNTTILNLSPGTTFNITVRAVNDNQHSADSLISVTTLPTVCGANFFGLTSDVECTPCPNNGVSLAGSQLRTDCTCIAGYEGNNGGSCTACAVRSFKPDEGPGSCRSCDVLLTTTSTGSVSCDACRFSSGTPGASAPNGCYPFESTTTLFEPVLSDSIYDEDTNTISLSLRFGSAGDNVFNVDGNFVGQLIAYEAWCMAVQGLIPESYTHVTSMNASASQSARVITFTSLLPLVEYQFNITLIALHPETTIELLGRPSPSISFITQAGQPSASTDLPQITAVTSTESNVTTVIVSYQIQPSIVSLISMLRLEYATPTIDSDTLQSVPFTSALSSRGEFTVNNLNLGSVFAFRLQTVIGIFTYTSNVVEFLVAMPTTTSSVLNPSTGLRTSASQSTNLVPNPTTSAQVTVSSSLTPTPTASLPLEPILPAPQISTNDSQVINGSDVIITWSVLTNSSGYTVLVYGISGELIQTISVIGEFVTEQHITGLSPFTTYMVRIAGVAPGGVVGELSEPFQLTTLEAPPGPPSEVTVIELIGDVVINVTWSPPSNPNGIITGYMVAIQLMDGSIQTFNYNSAQRFTLLTKPDVMYSVSVIAVNSAGASMPEDAIVFTEPTEKTLFSMNVIIYASVGGGVLLILICLCCLLLCCCCCCIYRRRKKTGRTTFTAPDDYTFQSGQEYESGSGMTKEKQLTAKRWMRLHGNYNSSSAVIAPLSQHLYTDDSHIETNMYAEVNEKDRRVMGHRPVPQTPNERPLPDVLQIVKDATPADYNNEELYMEMGKVYFADVDEDKALEPFEIPRSMIEIKEELGHGEFGRVMKATAKNVIPREPESTVAVKMLKEGASESVRKDFLGEAHMLAKFKHPNVLELLKVVTKNEPILVIIPFMGNGDLKSYLKGKKRMSRLQQPSKVASDFGVLQQLEIGEQVASGMEYLSAKYFIHRDLAARNILVGDSNKVKIADFGLSRTLAKENTYYHLTETKKLPVKWMALESLMYRKFSTYSDVWSFGIVLWEVFAYGDSPYKGVRGMDIADHIQKGGRLGCPNSCPQNVFELMQHCWKETKEQRPSFTDLKLQLKACQLALRREKNRSIVEGEETNEM